MIGYIFSIGCGPCSDLFGIAKHLIKNRKSVPVEYIGVDFNEQWRNVHKLVQERAEKSKLDINIRFYKDDISQPLQIREAALKSFPIT